MSGDYCADCAHRRYFHGPGQGIFCGAYVVVGGRKRRMTPCPCKGFREAPTS